MILINTLKNTLRPIISRYLANATLVEGVLKGTGKPFRCLFIENSNMMEYLCTRSYEAYPHILKKWKTWIPFLQKTIGKYASFIDLCIVVLPISYDSDLEGAYNFKTPEWVSQVLDISGSWENIRKSFHKAPKKTERKIIKYGLTYNISNDINDFKHFYYQMYLPLIEKQQADHAYIDTYEEMLPFFLKGFLLMVMENDHAIAGGLCFQEKNSIIFRRLGVLGADENYIKKGAQSAIYYFIISFAKETGFQLVDFMWSKPFLNDGIYKHKRDWGADVYSSSESECWIFFIITRHSENVVSFFENNPVIITSKDALSGLVGLRDGKKANRDQEVFLTKQFYAGGIKNLMVLTPDSVEEINYTFAGIMENNDE